MTRMPLAPLAVLLVLGLAFSGCLEKPSPVYVPASLLPQGWVHETNNESESADAVNLEIVINQYNFEDDVIASIHLIGLTDIPFVDEAEELDKAVKEQVESEGLSMTVAVDDTITLDNGQSAHRVEYDIQKDSATGSVRGKAWTLTWDTGDFVAGGFGYATTEYRSLLGTQSDDTQWRNVQEMMRAVDW